jgi:hypothetical protein
MSAAELARRLMAGHHPLTAELDQEGGPDGRVCAGHTGHAPPWPCLHVQAAEELMRPPAGYVDEDVFDEARAERLRAHAKHGATSMESTAAHDPTGRRLRVLLEELDEVVRELNDAEHEHRPVDLERMRTELVQVCAMAGAWAAACSGQALAVRRPSVPALEALDALEERLTTISEQTPTGADVDLGAVLKYHTDTVRRVLHLAAAIEDRDERGTP